MNSRLFVMLAAVAAVAWSIQRWRSAIKGVMVLVIAEGALRKWALPGAQDLIYLGKDVILLGAYAGFLLDARTRQKFVPPPAPLLYGSLALSAMVGALQVFNPHLPNVLVGILGFKAYFLYVPLLFILPTVFRDDRDVAQFLRWYVWLAIPVGCLAIIQFMSPSASVINTYARGGVEFVTTFGSSTHARVTGSFSYISGYASYLLATGFLALAMLGAIAWRWRGAVLLYAALGLTLLGMLMSGSRGPVVMLAALFPIYWWFGVVREHETGATVGRVLLVGGVLLGLFAMFGGEAFGAFVGRARAGGDISGRLVSPLLAPLSVVERAGLIGFGIGAAHQTATVVTKGLIPYSWLRGLMIENETGRVMVELGMVGFVLVYLTRIALAFFAWRSLLALRTRFHRALALAALLLFMAQIPGSIVFDVTSGLFYWFFAGLLMLAIRLDREAVAAAPAVAASSVRGVAQGNAVRRMAPTGAGAGVLRGR